PANLRGIQIFLIQKFDEFEHIATIRLDRIIREPLFDSQITQKCPDIRFQCHSVPSLAAEVRTAPRNRRTLPITSKRPSLRRALHDPPGAAKEKTRLALQIGRASCRARV